MANSKRKNYTAKQKAAYWAGVGISAAVHGNAKYLLESEKPEIKKSAIAGYDADNKKDASKKVFGK